MKPGWIAIAGAGLLLSACGSDAPEPEPTPTPTAEKSPVSILRPDVEQPPGSAELSPLATRVSFAEGGAELSESALAELATLRESPQVAAGGPITLRAHSDAGGSDAANMRASQARAAAVKDWLVEMGVDEDRIDVIAFGEQNPIEPNALPDGSPNEPGRAANRRVDVLVEMPRSDGEAEASAETPDEPPQD